MEKEQLIALIVEDLKHNKLLNGLDSIGLTDNGTYTLGLDLLLAELMGHEKGTIPDEFLTVYQSTMLSVSPTTTDEEMQQIASDLYNVLNRI